MNDPNPPIFRIDPRKPASALHIIATPIGAARDITLRALDLLAMADVLVAEDTRSLRHLMDIHGLSLGGRPLFSYHEHNGAQARPRVLRALAEGQSVVYASEAGTPLVADPGYDLVQEVIAAGYKVLAAPGPSAVLAALTVAGLPTDRFLFAGFAPAAQGARRSWLQGLAGIDATLVIYESPRRVGKTLGEMVVAFGESREVVLCRELTKKFEEVRRDRLGNLASQLSQVDLKGEVVLVLGRPVVQPASPEDLDAALQRELSSGARLKDAATRVAQQFNIPRREVYAIGLRMQGKEDGQDDDV
jgi:16S rRNA (cytidine1402-2'-O)-methyltransferase